MRTRSHSACSSSIFIWVWILLPSPVGSKFRGKIYCWYSLSLKTGVRCKENDDIEHNSRPCHRTRYNLIDAFHWSMAWYRPRGWQKSFALGMVMVSSLLSLLVVLLRSADPCIPLPRCSDDFVVSNSSWDTEFGLTLYWPDSSDKHLLNSIIQLVYLFPIGMQVLPKLTFSLSLHR